MGRKKLYFTEEERKAAQREYEKQWRIKNSEKAKEIDKRKCKKYAKNHPDKIKEINKESHKKYRLTQIGRAYTLLGNYIFADKKSNRGECTLTADWIINNIFTSKCHYCQNDVWTELGCDRIDNSLPHTPDNVVCCCEECNVKRGSKSYEEFCKEMGVIKIDEVLID